MGTPAHLCALTGAEHGRCAARGAGDAAIEVLGSTFSCRWNLTPP